MKCPVGILAALWGYTGRKNGRAWHIPVPLESVALQLANQGADVNAELLRGLAFAALALDRL